MIKQIEMKYSIGALLYTPALNKEVAKSVVEEKFGKKYSLALCLEDSIAEDSVELAEEQLTYTLKQINDEHKNKAFYLPKIFVRVRCAAQLMNVYKKIAPFEEIVCGFVFPKYSVENADEYNRIFLEINKLASKKLYIMPILESKDIVDYTTRYDALNKIKEKIDDMKDYVLNVRIGGNDFCNEFATRRHYDETIYDILSISQLMGDILTVFSREYVVSAPVWEFFSSDNEEWKNGLMKELKYDKINGFIGKTVIHPKQISVVNEMLKVSYKDYEDAKSILNWKVDGMQVGKSFAGERMNEVKTHGNWAIKILTLAEVYGIL
ncbi:HpcH/HpaI aldolase/citrate lyase family protein [Fusibacter bizertensis]